MDQLTGHWVGLEKQLYQRAFPQAVRLVLYDLTSVYFEGKGPTHLARYGHSRDHRADRPQIILAIATDTQGLRPGTFRSCGATVTTRRRSRGSCIPCEPASCRPDIWSGAQPTAAVAK